MDTKTALLTVLDQVDYTNQACAPTEMVGAVLPREVIRLARQALELSPTSRVLSEVLAERGRQDAKWGEQNHHPFTYLAVLGEEVGEANQAALQTVFGGKVAGDYRKELVHVAAVAVAMIECFDRHVGGPDLQQENFFDAVRADQQLTPDQKAYWLSLEPTKAGK